MSSYNFFAGLYDVLTTDVDYEVRSDYISGFFKQENINSGTIIDLACGTCSMSIPLKKMGYSIIGVDASPQMLTMAQNKINDNNCDIKLVNSNMQEFVMYDCAVGCICCLDSINHLTDINDVKSTFENVYNTLKNNSLFVFDVNTIYKHQNILFNNTFIRDEDDYYLVWDNEKVDDFEVRILLDFFVYNGNNYDRYSEEFCERAYSTDDLKKLLSDAGFSDINIYDDLTLNAPKKDSQRVYFVCKKV